MKTWNKTALLRGSVFAGLAAVAFAPAHAQEPEQTQPAEAAPQETETIMVTGSRIARRDAVAESPILSVGREEVTTSGYVTMEQYLNTLPQVTPGLSSQSNNPSSNGRAFIDLRGLGSSRNLVLVDGRRGMGSTAGGTVDVNTIPAALIENTEIITGGAAATYGADAVAGVVNFILRDDFEGIELDTQYRLTEQEDGQEWNTDFTVGGNFDDGRGNAVFSASYFNREAMYKDARDFSAQASSRTGLFPGGNWSTGTNSPDQAAVDAIFGPGACAASGGSAGFGFNPDGTPFCTGVAGDSSLDIVGYTGPDEDVATQFAPDVFSYNFEPDNILVLPMERWNMFTAVNYEVNDHFRPYARAQYTNYNATQELAATPASGFEVPVDNPFIGPELAALLDSRADPDAPIALGKRTNFLGGRTGSTNHDVFQITTGATGDIVGSWTYDVYASYGRSSLNEIQGGNLRIPQTQELLDADDGGASICAGGFDPFGITPVSEDCADYMGLEAKNLTIVEQTTAEATVNGDLFELPAGMVQAAFGAGYRSLDYSFQPDSGLQPGLVAGFNGQLPVSGFLDYVDVYGEVLVPLLRDLPLIDEMSVTAGFRQSDNNQSGTADSWKLNGDWDVNDWLRFRGGVQRAVRSPSVTELFSPQTPNFPNIAGADPCNSDSDFRTGPDAAAVQALCAQQAEVAGLPGFQQSFDQAEALSGGNPDLQPEEADSYTFGFVANSPWTDPALERLYLSVDYWSIEINDVIASVGATTIIERCFNRDDANPNFDINNEWCQLFGRDDANGRIVDLQQLARNQATTATSGADIVVGWGYDFGGYGDLDLNLIATWVEKYESQTTSADPVYDFVGTIGSGTGSATPEWRATLNTTYSLNDLSLTLTSRWIDAMGHSAVVTGSSPESNTGTPGTHYFDLRGTYDLTDNVRLRAGVNNLFDQEPRLYSPNVQANTDPSTFDVLGRRFFVGVNARF